MSRCIFPHVTKPHTMAISTFPDILVNYTQILHERVIYANMVTEPSTVSGLVKSFYILQVVYKRYASLYFVMGIDSSDNELITLELVHHFVEVLDRYFGNVCELDLIFNFHKVPPVQACSQSCIIRT